MYHYVLMYNCVHNVIATLFMMSSQRTPQSYCVVRQFEAKSSRFKGTS